MSETQSSLHTTPKLGVANTLADGVDVNRSLDNWRTYRTLLATTIKGYLAACADINSVCARASRKIYDRKDIESALAAVNAELTGLASEEESLRSARISLSATRNLSSALAPIHSLPPDVLTRIFTIMPSTNSFTGVSSYWRRVALSTPTLWTQMSISAKNDIRYHHLSLERSNGLPLYFHVVGEGLGGFSAFFKKAVPQIRILDIWTHSQTDVIRVLGTWFKHGSVGTAKGLRLRIMSPSYIPWNLPVWSAERAEAMLSSLTVLHLSKILIPCTSAAYHGLVDLRLSNDGCPQKIELSVSQLAGIFSASPNLSTLKITGFEVLPSDGPNAAATLVHLEVLHLHDMDNESLGLVMSLIPLSRCLNELSIGLEVNKSNGPLIDDFLRGAHIKTLACTMYGKQRGRWPLLLSTVIPSLEHLIIREFGPFEPSDIETLRVELEGRKAQNEFQPQLPHVYLASSRYDDDDLTFITRILGVQNLHVEHCKKLGSRGKLNGLEARLPEAPPNSVCTFTEVDTTAEWSCCSLFDRWV